MNNDELAAALLDEAISERVGQAGTSLPSLWMAKIVAKEPDGTLYADIVGGERRVPCQVTQVTAKVGDTVEVRFQDGRVIVTANRTDPPPAASENVKLEEKVIETRHEIQIVKSEKADVTELTAAKADISELRAGFAEFETVVTDDLLTANANISQLQAADVTITGRLDAAETNITSLQAEDARIGNLVAGKADISDLNAATARIDDLEADHVSTTDLQAVNGEITNLKAEDATINGKLTAAEANITSLQAEDVTINGKLTAAEGDIDTLQANTADIGTIRANSAKVKDVTAQQITAATGYISDLTAGNVSAANIISDHAAVGSLDTDYAKIDMANVNNAWISNGTIKDGAISSAMINDLSANKLTAGTINGSVINVTNLNADNITTGTINGERVGAGSLSLDKLSEDVYTESEVDAKLSTMQQQIDGAIETWTGTVEPTLNNAPASAWTTAADRDKHVGDVYFNTSNGYNYRFTKTGSSYSWQLIKDSDVTNALSRLSTAEGKIATFDQDISTLNTDTGTLKIKTQSLETSLGDKVDTSTFSELSSTVGENSASITSMSTVLTNNGLTSSTNITNTVNTVSQTASGNSSKISQLTTTLGTNADGTSAANDVMHRVSDVEQDLDGITTRVSKTEAHIAGDFALSTTEASTTAKTATITPVVTGWTLEKGVSVTVRFDKENTVAAPTLNVNSTGAKAIRNYSGNALSESAYKWKAGTAYSFTYDGTYWRLQDSLLTSRVTMAESTITQQADQISAKVSKDGVIAAINLSTETEGGSAVKIRADKVNIEGAAIFTGSGRLSQSSLDGAYDASGAADTALTDAKSYVDGKGYQTASDVSQAISAGTANFATKANAVKRTQRIYYRKNASGAPATPGTASSAWVTNGNTESSWTKYNAWSTRVPPIADTKDAAASSRYLYLYTCEQREMADGTLAYTTVLLDDSNTIIDGGNIITGSVAANKLDVYDATIQKIRADAIDVDSIVVGQDQVDGLDDDLTDLSNSIQQTSENLSDKLDNELGSFVPDKEKTMQVWGKLTADQIDVNDLRSYILQAVSLILGNPENVHIDASGTEMAFMNGLTKVAYIDAETGTFYMTKSVVLDDMYFGAGKWKWYKRSNNNMSVKWMG